MFKSTDDYATAPFGLDTCPELSPNGYFPSGCYDKARPTVAALGIFRKKEVLFVQSSKLSGEGDKPSWILPQGGVDYGRTVYQALAAQLSQEIGMPYTAAKLRELEQHEQLMWLGAYTNTIRNNPGSDNKPKRILIATVPVINPTRIKLNDENRKYTFVADQHALWSLLKHTRDVKRLAICLAINQAYALGFIEWSCKEVFEQFKLHGEVAA